MIPSTLGSSSYYSQYMREHRRRSPETVARDRLLTDRDAYLQHLEEQVRQVSAACMLADELKTSHNVLEQAVQDLDRKTTQSVQGVQESQALASVERKALERDVEELRERIAPLELLPDKLLGLEVELDRTRSSQNKIMLDKMSDLEERLSRMEQRHQGELRVQQEQLVRTTSHLQLVMENNERLERRCKELEEGQRRAIADMEQTISLQHAAVEESVCRLRDVTLPKAVSELSMAQERAAVETSKDLTRIRHEVGMAENRVLATLAKQAALAQEQVTQIQELVSEALAPPSLPYPTAASDRQHPVAAAPSEQAGASVTSLAADEVEDPARLARKVQVLSAAFRHAEEENRRSLQACREGMAGLRQALDTVQASVKTMAGQALECASRQTETVLQAVNDVEARLAATEEQVERVVEALHEADTRIELLSNRIRVSSPRPARARTGGKDGQQQQQEDGAAVDSPQASLPPPEFERVLELCVSMHQLAKRNARELEQLRDRVDRPLGSSSTALRSPAGSAVSTPRMPVFEGGAARSPSSPRVLLTASSSRPPRPQMKVLVHKTLRAKDSETSTTHGASSSPNRRVVRSPGKQKPPGREPEDGADLQQVMREVGDLFTAIEGRQVRVKRKGSPAASSTTQSASSLRLRSSGSAKRPSPVPQAGTASSTKAPRAETRRAPLHQPPRVARGSGTLHTGGSTSKASK